MARPQVEVRLEHAARDLAGGQQDVGLDLAVGEVHRVRAEVTV
jgi:hypothetical protein